MQRPSTKSSYVEAYIHGKTYAKPLPPTSLHESVNPLLWALPMGLITEEGNPMHVH